LSADELYEGEVDHAGNLDKLRLASTWRRDIDHRRSRLAIQVTRKSAEFRQIQQANANRPDYLGDLEAVSWTPPCESEYERWTIDVWYLLFLDSSMGKGRSFLVDPEQGRVIGVREFSVRSY
jgi:hypothetical protein